MGGISIGVRVAGSLGWCAAVALCSGVVLYVCVDHPSVRCRVCSMCNSPVVVGVVI